MAMVTVQHSLGPLLWPCCNCGQASASPLPSQSAMQPPPSIAPREINQLITLAAVAILKKGPQHSAPVSKDACAALGGRNGHLLLPPAAASYCCLLLPLSLSCSPHPNLKPKIFAVLCNVLPQAAAVGRLQVQLRGREPQGATPYACHRRGRMSQNRQLMQAAVRQKVF